MYSASILNEDLLVFAHPKQIPKDRLYGSQDTNKAG